MSRDRSSSECAWPSCTARSPGPPSRRSPRPRAAPWSAATRPAPVSSTSPPWPSARPPASSGASRPGVGCSRRRVALRGTGLPLVVAAADIVEHHTAVGQVSLRQLRLDGLLTLEQPIHGGIEFVLGGVLEAELLGERGVVPVARGGQLGAGEEESLG